MLKNTDMPVPTAQRGLVLVSGGQDSMTTLMFALEMCKGGVDAVCFDYGQRHKVELDCARGFCRDKGVTLHGPFPIDFLREVDTSLIGDGDTNDFATHHPRLKNLPASFVPGRNALMLTMAHTLACQFGARYVFGGMCETDYSGYPDCREEFITQLQNALNIGYQADIEFVTPLMHLTKAQTFELAEALHCLPDIIEQSHTCYNGVRNVRHAWGYGCGRCPACDLRRKGWDEYCLEAEAV